MKYTRKKSVYLFAGVPILFFLWLSTCFAAQTVQVVHPLEPGQSVLDIRQEVLNDGFVRGIVQETDAILPVPMNEARSALFVSYVKDKTRDLVLSYKELECKEQDEPRAVIADLSVSVNTQVLKKMLKDLGIFYTTLQRVPCSLTLTGFRSEDWQHLEDLQALTGVDVIVGGKQKDAVSVRLSKVGEDRWQGELTAFDNTFLAQGNNLDNVWFDLWEKYFHLPEVVSGVFSTVTFKVAGWYVTDGVSYFEDILLSWDRLVEQATLVHLDMADTELGGVWSVQTLNVQALRGRLETFLRDRGLHLLFFRQKKV